MSCNRSTVMRVTPAQATDVRVQIDQLVLLRFEMSDYVRLAWLVRPIDSRNPQRTTVSGTQPRQALQLICRSISIQPNILFCTMLPHCGRVINNTSVT
jgi:hypothetical protein